MQSLSSTSADLQDRLCRAIELVRQGSSDFDLNPDVQLPRDRVLKQAAVLLAITEDARLVLTKRSARLKHHPGQIAFPGGRKDDTDVDLVQAALREAQEEIALDPEQVTILGQLPPHETVTSYQVTPYVGLIPSGLTFVPEPGEVSEIFEVPLDVVLNPANFRVEGRRWRGQRRYYYAVPYGPYYIWGATARMLRGLAEAWA